MAEQTTTTAEFYYIAFIPFPILCNKILILLISNWFVDTSVDGRYSDVR